MRWPTREPHLIGAGIDLKLEFADRLPLVYVDHNRLEDVIVKLIDNAEAAIASRRSGSVAGRRSSRNGRAARS